MSRLFDGASTTYLEASSAVVATTPYTIAGWCRPNGAAITADLLAIVTSTSDFNLTGLGVAANTPRAYTYVGNFEAANATASISSGTWAHVAGVWASATSRKIYLNGGNTATNTVSQVISTVNRTNIGAARRLNPVHFWNGDLAEIALWNVALTDAEISWLAAGYSALTLIHRLPNLKLYQDLIRSLDRPGIGPAMTASGTSISAHARIMYPRRRPVFHVAAAGGAADRPRLISGRLVNNGLLLGGLAA